MSQATQASEQNIYGPAEMEETASAIRVEADAATRKGGGAAVLQKIAQKIAATRRPGADSSIPAGVTYLLQFATLDLDFLGQNPDEKLEKKLDLSLIYGDGPVQDAAFYQVPAAPGLQRFLLRLNRTRRTELSPPWGAARDLPRASCSHLDIVGIDAGTEVLLPNALSDSSLQLGQTQTIWVLLHNAIASTLASVYAREIDITDLHGDPYQKAFDAAQRITRGIYRDVLCHDLLGTMLMPRIAESFAARGYAPSGAVRPGEAPVEFMAGAARLTTCMVREIYQLNETRTAEGLRTLLRQTSYARPYNMPLTEDWLLDFSLFFPVRESTPQMSRAIGPHAARAFGAPGEGGRLNEDGSLVLRDLIACSTGQLRSVPNLIAKAQERDPAIFEGCFAGDSARWIPALEAWLAETGIAKKTQKLVAQDPPLTLFLMLEAEADTDGKTLGGLGSTLVGETIAAALPETDESRECEAARQKVFGGATPGTMGAVIEYLQIHYGFADGARLHSGGGADAGMRASSEGAKGMLDMQRTTTTADLPGVAVADHVEMGRLLADWATGQRPKPETVDELKRELSGIATVPERVTKVVFCQGDSETLLIRLPDREHMEQAINTMSDPQRDSHYPFPQFYADFFRPGLGPVMSPVDILMARIADTVVDG
ncbi:MAG: hypothetical protein AAGG56_02245 [Pseudomonadota bacterium]